MYEPRFHSGRRCGLAPAALAIASVILLAATPAQAYVGPGAGLSMIGTLVALVSVLCLAVAGFVWYPLKRLLRRNAPAPAASTRQRRPEK